VHKWILEGDLRLAAIALVKQNQVLIQALQ
jgi:hypothetical protein